VSENRWQPYPAYKDSGVGWIGQIPSHWEARQLKYTAPESGSKLGQKPDDLLYLGLENIESNTGRLLLSDPIEQVESTVVVFRKGDVLFGKLRPYLAKVVHADFDGVGTTELLVLRPEENVDGHFLFYHLLADGFIDTVDGLTYGTKMPRTNAEQIGNLVVGLPSLPEQRAIAAFLDCETAKLDALTRKQERLVVLLQEKRAALISHAVTKGLDPTVPVKDSGIPWLGEVPAHWDVKRLKFVANVQSGVAKGRNLEGRKVINPPYLRVANVQNGYVDLSDVATIAIAEDELERYSLQAGDVLMTEGGDFDKLGRGTVWEAQIDPCIHQNHIFAIRSYQGMSPYWISTITQTDYARHYFILRSKQSTNLASISSTNLMELPVVLPPSSEQEAILSYLDYETAKLDALIAKAREMIERLQEYRTALISAAVTGKIDVRGAG